MTRQLPLTKRISLSLGILSLLLAFSSSLQAQLNVNFDVTDAVCYNLPNGSVTATAFNGTPPYFYQWNTGDLVATISGLTAGTYTVTVSDAALASIVRSVTVGQPDIVTATLVPDDLCNEPFDITAIGGGGIPPYSYNWSTGAMTQTITNVTSGEYCVTLTDSNLCGAVTCITVVATPANVNVTANNVTCPNGTDGSVTATPVTGLPPFSYAWSNGAVGQTITNLTAGTYIVTMTDANGCTDTAVGFVSQPPAININLSPVNPICPGDFNGSVNSFVSGGTPPYNLFWNTGQTTSAINNLGPGTYSLTVIDANNCVESASVTLAPVSNLSLGGLGTPETCPDANDGFATASPQNGVMPYVFLWNTGFNEQVIENAAPGLYTVTVTDAVGCMAVTTVNVAAAPDFTVVASGNNPSTCGVNNGSATAIVTAGVGPFTYQWSNGQNTQTITNLEPGTYFVTVTNPNECIAVSSTTIVAPPDVFVNATATNILCPGANFGTATAAVSGGTPPFTINWSNGGAGNTINGLTAGTYSVTATDANGCSDTDVVVIAQAPGVSFILSGTNTVCGAGNLGSATVTPLTGTPPFSFNWSTGATSASVTGLTEGTHTVTVTDAVGCSNTQGININIIDDLIVTVTGSNVLCAGENTGGATAFPSGGNAPYTFAWSNGSTAQSINGLTAGTYTIFITDANGCTATGSYTVTQPNPLSVSIQSTNPLVCFGEADATLTAIGAGGTPPYAYAWSNGQVGPTIINLTAGTYTVTVTDANECTASVSFTVGQTSELDVNLTGETIVCGEEDDGFAGTVVTGGIPPYSYLWSNAAVTESITNLTSGTYSVTVTDNLGCVDEASITINVISDLSLNLIPRDALCFGENTGSVLAIASGGDGNYTYNWSNAAGNVNEITGLVAGSYAVTVTEGNGCTASATVNVGQPQMLVASVTGTSPLCNGEATGTATVNVVGGTPPYQYSWNNSATVQSLTGLQAGNYIVVVTDANFCTTTANINLVNPPALNVSVTAPTITCNSTNSGTATAIVTGGALGYTYLWSDGQTTPTAVNIGAGVYSLTVTDANGCEEIVNTIVVNELPAIEVDFMVTNLECTSDPIGSITATASMGTAPYFYAWSNGQNGATISNLAAGTYTVTVSDANGCRVIQSVEVTQTNGFTVNITATNVSCFENADGSATANVVGGQAPFAYIWSNGATTATINNLDADIYTVTVTDANECTATATVSITKPIQLVAGITSNNIDCGGDMNGSATASPTGGTPPYTFEWSNASTSMTITNLAAGTYVLTVTDANECTAVNSVTITAPPMMKFTITQNSGTCNNVTEGILVANVFGGTGPFSYAWSNGNMNQTASNLAPGTYSVTVTDANGCTATSTSALTTFPAPSCSVTVLQASTLGNNGSLQVNPTSGTAPYTYAWSNGATTQTINNLAPGIYTVTVTDSNGCQTTCSGSLDLLAGIGNYVWEDIDHDGQQDANEPAIPGVTVNLKNAAGVVIATTTTDMNGEYYFLGLDAGTYSVQFVVPMGMDYTASNMGDDALDSDIIPGMNGMTGQYTLDPGELDFTVDAGLFVPPNGAIIDPCTCLNNSTTEDNGQFSELFTVTSYPGETWTVIAGSGLFDLVSLPPPPAPVPVTLPIQMVETSPGIYAFEFLIVDDITYSATVTNGFSTLTVSNTCIYPTINIEELPPLDLCITDDPIMLSGSPTIPGTLVFTLNGSPTTIIDPSTLPQGMYELIATFTPDNPIECEATVITTFTVNDDCVAKLGDYVWEDIDHDGQQDADEPAIPNVTVNLKDGNGMVIDNTTTDANGMYCFYPLDPGMYSVQFVIPDGLDYTASNMGDDVSDSDIIPGMNGMTHTTTLEAGDEDITIDGGLYVPPNGVIGDPCSCLNNATTETNGQFSETFTIRSYPNEIWTIFDGVGMFELTSDPPPIPPVPFSFPQIMEEHEPGVYETTIRLLHATEYIVYATNGFDTLSISNYCEYPTLNIDQLPDENICLADAPIELGANPNIPGNLIFTINGVPNTTIDPLELNVGSYELVAHLVPLDPEECEANIETQFTVTSDCLAEVGDRVWLDLNCDGIQGGNEPGVPGVEVTITGTAEFLDPNVNMTTFTDANGNYSFTVPPGNYKLTFGTVPGYDLSPQNAGGNDEVDSDVSPITMMTEIFHLDAYEQNLSFDMGLCPECINIDYPGAIGYNQYLCAPGNDPEPLVSLAQPSGGDGPIEYVWMQTTGYPNTPIQSWEPIPNSNSPTYDPGPIFYTTYYARCARTQDCGTYIETNIIVVEVGDETTANILGNNQVCLNGVSTFTAVDVEPFSDVVWNFPGATPASASGTTVSTTYTNGGNYVVELIVTLDGCTAYDYLPVSTTTLPTVCGEGLIINTEVTNPEAGNVMVSWEMNVAAAGLKYHIEHSEDGEHFSRIATVTDEVQILNGIRYFEYESHAPKMGLNYYRVQLEDANTNTVYSNIEEVILYTDSKIAMLYPNPVTNELHVEIFETFEEQEVALDVYAVSGQKMASIAVENGNRNVVIDFEQFPAGAYLVRLRLGETNIRTMKVIRR